MAFENLGERLQATFKRLRGRGKVNEKDVKEAMREIKLALLEADVNFKVVKDFIGAISEKAMGSQVLESLTPGQQIIKIVRDEMVELMGGAEAKIQTAPKPPTVIMLVGLQGAGKTTTAAKLAAQLKKQGKRPILAACDVYRPAAIKQLHVVGDAVGVKVFSSETLTDPVEIARQAVANVDLSLHDTVIIDTAGRLHINEELMGELKNIRECVAPTEILLVVDAMTGQDAVNVAQSFNEQLGVDGIIISKLDGDTRGGVALSVKAVTGKPIKFAATGEKLTDLEPFHPDRMASRILGMGDVLSLIDKAQEAFDEEKAIELEKKIRSQGMDLNDFLDQLQQMKNMGPLSQIIGMIPGVNAKALEGASIDDGQLARTEAIILSMTPRERINPRIIGGSRKKRIARGSGVGVHDVNALLKQFETMQKMMKQLGGGGSPIKKHKKMKMRFPFA